MDFDKAGNSKDLDNEKLQLICKAYNRELLSNQRVVDGINSMDDSKLKILCKYNNKFSHKVTEELLSIEELLSNKEIVDNINGYDDEMFRSILDCASSELNILEILKGGEVCNTNNEFESSDSEEDEDLGDSFDCEESDEEMVMSSKSQSDNEEDKSYSHFHGKEMETSSENQNDCEEIVKQQLFIDWQLLHYSLLSEEKDERSKLCKDIASSGLTKLEIYRLIVSQFFINDEKLQHILKKFSPGEIIEILKDQTAVVNITHYNDEELEHVFNICIPFTTQNTIKVLSIDPEKLRLIYNKCNFSDTSELLENQDIVNHLSFIGYEKLQFILCNYKFLLSDIIGLLKNRKVVENIISFNIEKFQLIFCDGKLKSLDIVKITELLEDQDVVKGINSITPEKLKLILNKFNSQDIIKVLEDQDVVKGINSIALEKLELIFNKLILKNTIQVLEDQEIVDHINSIALEKLKLIFDKFAFINIIKVLEDQKIVDCINSIDAEKFRSLLDNERWNDTIIALLENQDAVKYINSVKNEELEAIMRNITDSNIVNIFTNLTPDIKSTLRFVIPLFRAGQVRDINIDYLNNKERIYEDIIKYVPQDLRIYTQYPFPGIGIDVKDLPQGLDIDIEPFIPLPTFKRCTESKEPVSKLYNLSLEQVIENINPHKKARYS